MGTARQLGRLALRGCLVLVLLLGATPEKGVSDPNPSEAPVEIRRVVVGLYNSPTEVDDPASENPLAVLVEGALNWHGIQILMRDVAEGPPPASLVEGVRGVVTWFGEPAKTPDWVVPWLREQRVRGLRVVHLETLPGQGAAADGGMAPSTAAYLQTLGLRWAPKFIAGPARVSTKLLRGEACKLERDPRLFTAHVGLRAEAADVRPWVETRDRLEPEDVGTPVLTAPWGGIALHPFVMKVGEGDGSRRWSLDLFAYLYEALGLTDDPVPAPQVAFGRRVFLFHIDGDGFESLSVVESGAYCAKVMRDAIFERYRIPMTISIIVAGLTNTLTPESPTDKMELARTIFAMPHVEVASHGVLHPFAWRKPWGPGIEQLNNFGYPRLEGFTYSPAEEVRASIAFIDRFLAPKGKPTRVMLWTGDCLPPESAVAAAAEAGCWNLNGGTYRWDASHDSVGFVPGLGRQIGARFQVYAGAANDNEYPGFFDNNPGAFGHVDTTIERTGKGRILKPANIYAHFYSAERHVRLETLARIVERWAEAEPTIPLFVSQYAAAAHESRAARVLRTEEGWQLRGWGACRTARLEAPGQYVDFARSRGVVAANRLEGRLFVTLSGPDADLILRDTPGNQPHVEESDHWLEDVRLSPSGVAFTSRAWRTRGIVLAGFPPSTDLQARAGSEVLALRSDAEGRVRLALPPEADAAVEVSVP